MLLPSQQRRSFDYKIVAAYLAGTLSGALLTAIVAWVLSGFAEPLVDVMRAILLVVGSVFVWMCKHGPLTNIVVLPEARRQIPAEVFGGSLIHGAYRFGIELGTGVRTYTSSSAPYVLLLTIIFAQLTLANALFVGLGFGFGRAVPLIAQLLAARQMLSANSFLREIDQFVSTTVSFCILIGGLSLV